MPGRVFHFEFFRIDVIIGQLNFGIILLYLINQHQDNRQKTEFTMGLEKR